MFGDSQVFGFSQGAEGSPEAKKIRQEDKMTCLPVTIRTAEAAMGKASDEGDIRFFGTEAGMLLFVGVVETVANQAGSIEFLLNDATGRMRARYYADDSQNQFENIKAGTYVSLAGQLRASPTSHISVTNVRPVQTADEVSYHMIEAAHAALRLQKPHFEPHSSPVAKMPSSPEVSRPPAAPSAAEMRSVATPMAKLQHLEGSALQSAIQEFIREKGDGVEEGVSVADICKHVAPAPEVHVRTSLAKLVAEGEIFSTIDDNHFSAI